MLKFLRWFEQVIVLALIVMMMLVVLLSTIELGWELLQELLSPPWWRLEGNELLDMFGLMMLVLIGLELLDTLKAYFIEHAVHAEIVIEVALIAIVRKIIVLEVKELPSLTLLGLAALVLALGGAYFVVKHVHASSPKV